MIRKDVNPRNRRKVMPSPLAWRMAQAVLALWVGIGVGWAGWRLLAPSAAAAAPGSLVWPQIFLTQVASGLSSPVHITHAGDGSGRLFVVEQRGIIRILKNGVLVGTPFLDIASRVLSGGERGLLSVAFPPGYGTSRDHFYVYYTNLSGNLVIARYRVSVGNADQADAGSEQVILTINHPSNNNHNGGQLAFGPQDDDLYIGTGDGGSSGDPPNNAQNPNVLLGKVLRIDVETGSPLTYTIPVANPYTSTMGYRGEIWALGLRNPWRFSFDRQTYDLYIGDVGQDTYEEIDYQPASSPGGENYGWRIMEGMHCYNAPTCDQTGLILPVAEYSHGTNDSIGCSVTGGFVYRGARYAFMQGFYFYADYCTGRIWGLKYDGSAWQNTELLDTSLNISSFGEDETGNLYLADRGGGKIYLIGDLEIKAYLPLVSR